MTLEPGVSASAALSLAAFAIDELTSLVGNDLRPKLKPLAASAWARDACARGSYSYALPGHGADKITVALQGHFANPAAVLQRLQARSRAEGSAREDVTSRSGTFRLTVQGLSADRFLWRLDELSPVVAPARGAEGILLPMLTANRQGVVLFANDAMRRLLGERPRRLDRLLKTAAAPGEVVRIDTADGPMPALLAELTGPGDRREIYVFPAGDRPASAEDGLFDGLPVALLRFDPEGMLIGANRAARASATATRGLPAERAVTAETRARSISALAAGSGVVIANSLATTRSMLGSMPPPMRGSLAMLSGQLE